MIQPRQYIKLLQTHLDPRGLLQVFLHPSLEQQSFSNLQAPDEEQRPAEALAPPAEDGLEILDGRTQRVQRFWSGICRWDGSKAGTTCFARFATWCS